MTFTAKPEKFSLQLGDKNDTVIRVEQNANGGDVDLVISQRTMHPDIREERRLVLARESAKGLAEALLNPPEHK